MTFPRTTIVMYGAPPDLPVVPNVDQEEVRPQWERVFPSAKSPALAPCTRCNRHIVTGTECPFCHADYTAARKDLVVDELAPLREALAAARAKHPEGSNLAAVCSELGELADEMLIEPRDELRIRAEAMDLAVTALRIAFGERALSVDLIGSK